MVWYLVPSKTLEDKNEKNYNSLLSNEGWKDVITDNINKPVDCWIGLGGEAQMQNSVDSWKLICANGSKSVCPNSLFHNHRIANGSLGACPQTIFLMQHPPKRRKTPFWKVDCSCFHHRFSFLIGKTNPTTRFHRVWRFNRKRKRLYTNPRRK